MPTWLHHLATTYFQWCLFPLSLYGQRLVGRKRRSGYLWGLVTQALWVIYALALSQPLMLVGTLSYAATYVWYWLQWGREARNLPPLRSPLTSLRLWLSIRLTSLLLLPLTRKDLLS